MPDIRELWQEFEDGKTPEAMIANDMEIVDMLLQAFEYIQNYPEITDLQEFMEKNGPRVKTDLGKRLVAEIKSAQEKFFNDFKL